MNWINSSAHLSGKSPSLTDLLNIKIKRASQTFGTFTSNNKDYSKFVITSVFIRVFTLEKIKRGYIISVWVFKFLYWTLMYLDWSLKSIVNYLN